MIIWLSSLSRRGITITRVRSQSKDGKAKYFKMFLETRKQKVLNIQDSQNRKRSPMSERGAH
jgi:hypothetical protein